MAAVGDSPTRCQGQSWTAWAQRVGLGVAHEDSEEDDHEAVSKREGDSMKLRREDMPLFGFCPARDDFYLVVCEACHQVVKPQALHKHIQLRHSETVDALLNSSCSGHQNSEVEISLSQNLSDCHFHYNHHYSSHLHSSLSKEITDRGKGFCSSPEFQPTSISDSTFLTTSTAISTVSSYVASQPNITFIQQRPAVECNIDGPCQLDEKDAASTSPSSYKKSHSLSSPVVRVERMLPCVITKVSSGMISPTFALPAAVQVDKRELPALQDHPPSLTPADSPVPSVNPVHQTIAPKITTSTTNSFSGMPPSSLCSSLLCFSQQSPSKNVFVAAVNDGRLKPFSKSKSKEPKERKLLPCKDRVYDPDKHCGVFVQEFGKQCTRSLTCKSHSVAMRRNVAGRKKHFDELLADHRATKETILRVNKGIAGNMNSHTEDHQQTSSCCNADDGSRETNVSSVSSLHRIPSVGSNKTSSGSARFTHVSNHDSNRMGANCGFTRQRLFSPGVHSATVKCKPEILNRGSSVTTSLPRVGPVTSDYDSSIKFATSGGVSFTGRSEISKEIGEDCGCLMQHPKPAAACSFNARQMGMGFYVYNRRLDNIRAVLRTTLGERVPLLSPIKKLCVESRLPPVPEPSDPSDPYCFTIGDQQMMPQGCNNGVPRLSDQSSKNEDTNLFSAKHLMVLKGSGQRSSLARLKEKQPWECGTLSATVYGSSKSSMSLMERSNNFASTSEVVPTIPSLHSIGDKTASPHCPSVKRKRGSLENKNGKNASSNHRTSMLTQAHQQLLSVATTTSGTTGLLPMTFSVSLNAKLTTAVSHINATSDCSFAPLMVATSGSNPSPNVTQIHSSVSANTTKDLMMAHLGMMNGQLIPETRPCLTRTRVGASCVPISSNSAAKGPLTSLGLGLTTPGLAVTATFATGLNRVYPLSQSSNVLAASACQQEHQAVKHARSSITGRATNVPNVHATTDTLISSEAKWAMKNSSDRLADVVSVPNVGQQSEVQSSNSHVTFSALSVEGLGCCITTPTTNSKVLVTGNVRAVTRPCSPHQTPLSNIGNGLRVSPSARSTCREAGGNHITSSNSSVAFACSPESYTISPSHDLLLPNSGCLTVTKGRSSNQLASSKGLLNKKGDCQDHRATSATMLLSSTQVNFAKSSIGFKPTSESNPFHDVVSSSSPHFSSTGTAASRRESSAVPLGSSHL